MFAGLFGQFVKPRAQVRPQARMAAPSARNLKSASNHKLEQSEEVAESKKGLFSAGQQFDAKRFVRDLFAQAKHSIDIIDGYVGEDVLNLLTVKLETVHVRLLTGKISPVFLTLARDFIRQYKGLEIRSSKAFHDRFIIVDNAHCYHFGASLEHLGNKAFMFSKIEESSMQQALLKQRDEAWKSAECVV